MPKLYTNLKGKPLKRQPSTLGKNETSLGLTLVELSRLKNYIDFLILPFTCERIDKICESISLKPRLNEDDRNSIIFMQTLRLFYLHLV